MCPLKMLILKMLKMARRVVGRCGGDWRVDCSLLRTTRRGGMRVCASAMLMDSATAGKQAVSWGQDSLF